jgi:hypothetical protein
MELTDTPKRGRGRPTTVGLKLLGDDGKREYFKQYYHKTNETLQCSCGKVVGKRHLARHKICRQHIRDSNLRYMEMLQKICFDEITVEIGEIEVPDLGYIDISDEIIVLA